MSRLTLNMLRRMKTEGNKIAVLTAYDASFSQLLEGAGVEVVLVGDSLGMVVQGQESTIPVTMDEMIYHTKNVLRGSERMFVITDLPFMSYANTDLALQNAARLMAEGGAQMVKLEGGAELADRVAALSQHGIPVCSHLGLLPQSVHKLGGYLVQGREPAVAEKILQDALTLEQAGADMLLLECVPAALAKTISERVTVPVIGIGAGADCDGQVLVLYDMLGITPGKRPRFSHDFLADSGQIPAAVRRYVEAVKSGAFPGIEQQY